MTGIGQYRIRYDEETLELDRSGTTTPRGSRVLAHRGDYMAVKIPGQHYYGGQGQPQNYAGARFEVYRVVREDGDGWMIVEPVIDFPVRS